MAVEVIDTKPAAGVIKKRICKNCGVTVTYLPKDVVIQHAADFFGCGTGGMKWITCPNCDYRIILKEWS